MVPRRSEDSFTGGASGETVILGVSMAGSVDLGVFVVVDLEMGVKWGVQDDLQGLGGDNGCLPGFLLVCCVGRSFHDLLTS
ncbi:UNVERIFIED_CONTAM: hypothetical protein Sradi_2522500 [Sesamum radiatum]|uniref:Uncharacterized protein n=1 Tax=Sesamum radiatum TaxID=300843 RepID=A0AAW2SL59_SESRA